MLDVNKTYKWNFETGNMPGDCNYGLEYNMLKEEVDETKHAMWEWDLIEIVDWLVDILFVAFGTCYKLGIDVSEVSDIISEDFSDSDIWYITTNSMNKVVSDLLWMKTWLNLGKIELAKPDLFSAIINTYKTLCILLWDRILVIKCYEEVCKSNFSKLPFEKDSTGKIKKWKNFRKPNLTKIIRGSLVWDKFWI